MNPRQHTNRSAELEEELLRLPDERRLEFIRTWELIGKAENHIEDVPTLDDAWTDVKSRIELRRRTGSPRRERAARRSSTLRHRSLVAGGVLLAAAAMLLWMWQRPVTAVSSPGELTLVTLEDGSTIHLNSGSRLRYRTRALPGGADLLRQVALDGEAFFDVTPAEQPFIVEAGAAVVEVLGTRFNVRARTEHEDHTTEVTLASGRVRVSDRRAADGAVILTQAGERVQVGSGKVPDSSLVTEVATLDYVLAWRRDAFAAIDRPMASIIAELERKFALNIAVRDGVEMQESMTLLYGPGTTAERILHDICLVQGCRYRPTTNGFALFMPSRESNN